MCHVALITLHLFVHARLNAKTISCRGTGWSLTGAHNEHGWENLVEKERETPTNLMNSDKLSLLASCYYFSSHVGVKTQRNR